MLHFKYKLHISTILITLFLLNTFSANPKEAIKIRYICGIFRSFKRHWYQFAYYGVVRYFNHFNSNGLHNPHPYLVSELKGVTQSQGETGTALGIFNDAIYITISIILANSDRLYLYADGVTERVESTNNMFPEHRLKILSKQYIKRFNTKELVNFPW